MSNGWVEQKIWYIWYMISSSHTFYIIFWHINQFRARFYCLRPHFSYKMCRNWSKNGFKWVSRTKVMIYLIYESILHSKNHILCVAITSSSLLMHIKLRYYSLHKYLHIILDIILFINIFIRERRPYHQCYWLSSSEASSSYHVWKMSVWCSLMVLLSSMDLL